MQSVAYPHEGRDLTPWGRRLGCAGKLMGARVSDARRIKPDAAPEAQPSLRTSCELMLGALEYLRDRDMHFFRVPSGFCPYATHPEHPDYWYSAQLPAAADLVAEIAARRAEYDIGLSFHPSQYILLSSERPALTASSVGELAWQADLLDRWGSPASMRVFLHGGGVYGDRERTRARIIENVLALPPAVHARFALENDEYSWNVEQLLPICEATGVPLVVDVHHHALNPGDLDWTEALDAAMPTWGESEPKIHLSSPRDPDLETVAELRAHHDFIRPETARSVFAFLDDRGYEPWVMLEAKRKDEAVVELRRHLTSVGRVESEHV